MSEDLNLTTGLSGDDAYKELFPQLKALLEPEKDLVANMANTAAALKEAFGWLWVGFYVWDGTEFVLGPFQGPVACTRIAMGKGVCGTSAAQQKVITVPDVDQFPGHIACSPDSRSEIVVPLVVNGVCELLLDADSAELNGFSEADERHLPHIVGLLGKLHY